MSACLSVCLYEGIRLWIYGVYVHIHSHANPTKEVMFINYVIAANHENFPAEFA